jgi:hypothetical protein
MKSTEDPAVNIDESRIVTDERDKDRVVKIDEPRTVTDQTGTVSQAKLNANRQNAKKSTGPRTPRGKACSRKNAIKHGLFTGVLLEFVVLGEAQAEYDQLLDDLRKHLEPIGRAEELEVERIALCWWKLKRAWRYENSVNQFSVSRARTELEQVEKSCKRRDQEMQAIILGLENMISEISGAAELPPDLKNRFFVLTSTREQDWQNLEHIAEDLLKENEPCLTVAGGILPPERRRRFLAVYTLRAGIAQFEIARQTATPNTMNVHISEHAIPKGDALDNILRYEPAIERSLDRALNRLERLQRRRKGEPVLPPVNVQLTT